VDAQPDVTAPQRSTRQRRAVLAELTSSSDFRSAQEIHEALRKRGDKVGLATVYRALQALVEGGDVDAVTHAGETVYRRCSDHRHHHHLVCRHCGRTVEVTRPAVERWATSVAEEHGYRDVDHIVEFIGTCPECAATR
jgi:Fur family transcriptional regulator, ferric uptake regulator